MFRKPTFDDEIDKTVYQATKEADEVLEVRPAPVPTKQMETEYMDFLQADMKSDPWVTYRFRKYTANPKRIPWKNQRKLKRQYQFTFATNWAIGSILAWPVAAMFGRSMKTTAGGVPMIRLNRVVHDFPHSEPGLVARKTFRYYSFMASAALGYMFARYFTDVKGKANNEWFSRPDLKPYAAMVKVPGDESALHSSMRESQYVGAGESEGKRSPLYRFFMARDADYTIKENPYQTNHPDDVWDEKKGWYQTYTNNFGQHHQ